MSPYSLSFGQDTYGKQTVFGPRRVGHRRKRAAAGLKNCCEFLQNSCICSEIALHYSSTGLNGFGGAPFVKRFNAARFGKEKVVAAVESENGECSVRSDGGCRGLLTVGALCGNIELVPHGVLVLRK